MQIPKPDLHRVRMVQKQQNPTSSEKKNRSPTMTAAGKKNRAVYRSRATNRLRNTPEERVTQNKQTFEVSVRFLHATASVRVEEDLQTFFNGSAQNLSFCMLQLLSELKKIYRLFSTVLLRISHSACYSFCQS